MSSKPAELGQQMVTHTMYAYFTVYISDVIVPLMEPSFRQTSPQMTSEIHFHHKNSAFDWLI